MYESWQKVIANQRGSISYIEWVKIERTQCILISLKTSILHRRTKRVAQWTHRSLVRTHFRVCYITFIKHLCPVPICLFLCVSLIFPDFDVNFHYHFSLSNSHVICFSLMFFSCELMQCSGCVRKMFTVGSSEGIVVCILKFPYVSLCVLPVTFKRLRTCKKYCSFS